MVIVRVVAAVRCDAVVGTVVVVAIFVVALLLNIRYFLSLSLISEIDQSENLCDQPYVGQYF